MNFNKPKKLSEEETLFSNKMLENYLQGSIGFMELHVCKNCYCMTFPQHGLLHLKQSHPENYAAVYPLYKKCIESSNVKEKKK